MNTFHLLSRNVIIDLTKTASPLLPAPLADNPLDSSTFPSSSSWDRKSDFLLSISAVLLAVPAANTDFGKAGACRTEEVFPLPVMASSRSPSSRCRKALLFAPACALFALLWFLPCGVRKRAGRGSCDLHMAVFEVQKWGPCWKKAFKGLCQILTLNMKVEPIWKTSVTT